MHSQGKIAIELTNLDLEDGATSATTEHLDHEQEPMLLILKSRQMLVLKASIILLAVGGICLIYVSIAAFPIVPVLPFVTYGFLIEGIFHAVICPVLLHFLKQPRSDQLCMLTVVMALCLACSLILDIQALGPALESLPDRARAFMSSHDSVAWPDAQSLVNEVVETTTMFMYVFVPVTLVQLVVVILCWRVFDQVMDAEAEMEDVADGMEEQEPSGYHSQLRHTRLQKKLHRLKWKRRRYTRLANKPDMWTDTTTSLDRTNSDDDTTQDFDQGQYPGSDDDPPKPVFATKPDHTSKTAQWRLLKQGTNVGVRSRRRSDDRVDDTSRRHAHRHTRKRHRRRAKKGDKVWKFQQVQDPDQVVRDFDCEIDIRTEVTSGLKKNI